MKCSLSQITLTSRNNLSHRADSVKSLTLRAERGERSLILAHLEEQVEICMGKYESQKRRCIMIEEHYEKVKKDHQEMVLKLAKLKKKQGSSQAMQINTKVQSLELSLQQAIQKHDDLLSNNCRLKDQVTERRIDKKNLKQKQRSLQTLLQELTAQLSLLKQQNSSVQQGVHNQRFLMHNILYQNDNQKVHYNQKLETQYSLLHTKPRSIHVKDDVEIMDCLTLVKARVRKLMTNNRNVVKDIEIYKKIMEVLDSQLKMIMNKCNLSSIEEVKESFARFDQRNISLKDYISHLNQKAQKIYQNNTKIKQSLTNEKRTLRDVHEEQSNLKHSNSQQLSFYQSTMCSSKTNIDRLASLSQNLSPTLQTTLEFISKQPCFAGPSSPTSIQNIDQSTFLQKLSLIEKYLGHYIELKNCLAEPEPFLISHQKHRIRRQAPLVEIIQNQEKSLLKREEMQEFANQVLAKKMMEKSQRFIANVSWVKDAVMPK